MSGSQIAISEITTAQWSFEEDVEQYGKTEGVDGIGVWRDKLAAFDGTTREAADLIDDAGLSSSSLIFAGGFTDPEEFDGQIADAKRAIADAQTLGAPVLLVLAGPRLGGGTATIDESVRQALDALAPVARDAGITLALEPLHPIDVTRFSSVVTMDQALDIVDGIDGVGLMYDTWNTWWEPELAAGIDRAGSNLAAVQLADWSEQSGGPRDREAPGRGEAPLEEIVDMLGDAGYEGWYEVELFCEQYDESAYPDLLTACVDGTREVL
jgi:sugar phosphate isomerase/epimerase